MLLSTKRLMMKEYLTVSTLGITSWQAFRSLQKWLIINVDALDAVDEAVAVARVASDADAAVVNVDVVSVVSSGAEC